MNCCESLHHTKNRSPLVNGFFLSHYILDFLKLTAFKNLQRLFFQE